MQKLTIAERIKAATVFAAAAVAGVLFLSNASSQGTSCSQIPDGSWFHAEYCEAESKIAQNADQWFPSEAGSNLYVFLNPKD